VTADGGGRKEGADLTDKVLHFSVELTYMIIVSALWLVCSLPVVTAGAASVGAYAALIGRIDGSRETVRPFFAGFRAGLRLVTGYWLVFVVLAGLFAFNTYYYVVSGGYGAGGLVLAGIQALAGGVALVVVTHIFALAGADVAAGEPGDGGPAGPKPVALRRAWPAIRRAPGWAVLTAPVTVLIPAIPAYLGFWPLVPLTIGLICYANARLIRRSTR